MSRLAILEEVRRRSSRLPQGLRERIIAVISEALGGREEIKLALVFGGLLVPGKPVRDIDVAVYTGYRVGPGEWPLYVDELRDLLLHVLRRRLGVEKAVDVVLLEYVPPGLRAAILRGGRVVVDREPGLRAVLLLQALDELRGLERARRIRGEEGRRRAALEAT
jgi:predicted nucleotidyltransferase